MFKKCNLVAHACWLGCFAAGLTPRNALITFLHYCHYLIEYKRAPRENLSNYLRFRGKKISADWIAFDKIMGKMAGPWPASDISRQERWILG